MTETRIVLLGHLDRPRASATPATGGAEHAGRAAPARSTAPAQHRPRAETGGAWLQTLHDEPALRPSR
jgi:hypothetical protein